MKPAARLYAIFNHNEKYGDTSLVELAKIFSVSEMTIRRNVESLQTDGAVQIRLGVVSRGAKTSYEPPFSIRVERNAKEKREIATTIAQEILDGEQAQAHAEERHRHAGALLALHGAIGNDGTADEALVDLEDLLHERMAYHLLSCEWIKQAKHGVPHLINEFVDDGVKLDLNAFTLGHSERLIFHLGIKSNDDGI